MAKVMVIDIDMRLVPHLLGGELGAGKQRFSERLFQPNHKLVGVYTA